jgi:predicted DsbA family dithiol-disulfide isomerase
VLTSPDVRKRFLFFLLGLLVAFSAPADEETRKRLIRYFGGWYSWYPNSLIRISETREVAVPGLECYRVSRTCESKAHQESNVVLFDRERDEIFVGEAFSDDRRRFAKRAFDPATDLREIEASLSEAYGLPAKVTLEGKPRGSLRPIAISLRQAEGAIVSIPGFVSEDGSALMLGEFHPLAPEATAFRKRLIQESEGARTGSGSFYVTEFLDFQCERCRVLAPEVKKAVAAKGGAIEVRFLPLTKAHDWAFAAGEYAAALANVRPALYATYEEALFGRTQGMDAKAAKELALDIAEAAGSRNEFEAEISSGRARDRVLRDIRLAMRLGISGTPAFIHEGNFVSGEKALFETYLADKLGRGGTPSGR